MADNDQSRTEAPTPRRREEARDEGRVARSGDLALGLGLLSGALYLWLYSGELGDGLIQRVRGDIFAIATRREIDESLAVRLLTRVVLDAATLVSPMVLVVGLAGAALAFYQAGFRVVWKAVQPDLGKLNPAKGWANLFSQRAAVRGLMAVVKAAAAAAVAYWVLSGRWAQLTSLGVLGLSPGLEATWSTALHMMIAVSAGLLLAGVLDYLYQFNKHEEELKMTRQELIEEHRRDEGDPQVKAKLKKLRKEHLRQQMLSEVPDSTVVVRNPEHYAVALKYEQFTMAAPVVIAKGADRLAQRILKIAEEHGVPIVERKPLARALYASVDVGQPIPESLYKAIAEVLAYVYRIDQGRSQRSVGR